MVMALHQQWQLTGSAMTFTNTAQTAQTTLSIPAPGNTTTSKLTIRLAAYQTGSTAQSQNFRISNIALTGSAIVTATAPTVTTDAAPSVNYSYGCYYGGNVTATGGAAISANGIVYALTSLNATPAIGGGSVTQLPTGSPGYW
jgi:hypothetical protein